MPDFYIDSNSTLTPRTGLSWDYAWHDTAEYLAGSPSSGDELWYASDSQETYNAAQVLTYPNGILAISVNSSTNQYEAGAIIETDGGVYSLTLKSASNNNSSYNFIGISIKSKANMAIGQEANIWTFLNSTLQLTGTSSSYNFNSTYAGCKINLIDSSLLFGATGQYYHPTFGAEIFFDNVTFNSNTTKIFGQGGGGGYTATIINSDLSVMPSGSIIPSLVLASDRVHLEMVRCLIPASVNIMPTLASGTQTADLWSCHTGSRYYYFNHLRHEGKAVENATVKRTSGATYDGTNGFTAKLSPNSNVQEFIEPLSTLLKAPKLDLSPVGGVVLRVHILLDDSAEAPASLTTKNCRIKAVYPDGTSTALGKIVYSNPTVNILTTATDISTETVTFTGHSGTDQKQHYLDLTIPQNTATGMDEAIVELWLEVSKDLSTGTTEMFVCPKPTVDP